MFQQINEIPGLYIANNLTANVSEFSGFASFRQIRPHHSNTRIQAAVFCPGKVTFNIELDNHNLELWKLRFNIEDRSGKTSKKAEFHCRNQVLNHISPVLGQLLTSSSKNKSKTRSWLLTELLTVALNRSSDLKTHMASLLPVHSNSVKVEFRPEEGVKAGWPHISCHWIGRKGAQPIHHQGLGIFKPKQRVLIAQWPGGNKPTPPSEQTIALIDEAINNYYLKLLKQHIENNSKIRS